MWISQSGWGLSTATVSNVIHGKTSKMSPRTAQRVWQELETVGYIPDMAGVWLAQKKLPHHRRGRR